MRRKGVRAAMATSLILALSVPTAQIVARLAPPAQAAGCADRVTACGVERRRHRRVGPVPSYRSGTIHDDKGRTWHGRVQPHKHARPAA